MSGTWEAGGQGGVPWWWGVLGVIAAAVVVIALVAGRGGDGRGGDERGELAIDTATETTPVPPPVRLRAPDVTAARFCPEKRPVPVVAGTVYPPTFPWEPQQRPELCFHDVGAARTAGYDLPPLPADARRVAGVYLVPRNDTEQCTAAATAVRHAVPCPVSLPFGGDEVVCAGRCLRGGGYVYSLRRFEIPSRWCEGCVPELVVAAAPARERALVSALTDCGPRSPQVQRHETLRECADDPAPWAGLVPHAGATLRRGRIGGVVYAVSAAGHGQAQAALVTYVFDSLSFVRP